MHPTARFGLALVLFFSVLSSLVSAATGIIRNAPVGIEDAPLPAVYDLDAPATIDLDNHFAFNPATSGDFAKITTPLGDIYIEFLAADAPLSVTNFKSYLATDSTAPGDLIKTYDDVFVHRLAKGFVLQTGGYKIAAPLSLQTVTKKPKVTNEFKVANTRGTLAMAKVGNDPNSATNEWFINLADNRANLDNQNGGFTAFARVLGDGMVVADRIAALKVYDVDANEGSTFDTVPLRYSGGALNKSHFINLTKIRAVSAGSVPADAKTLKLAYSIIANSNPQVATATIDATGALSVRKGKMTGHTYMTLRVQAVGGHFLDVPFTVVRAGVPLVVKQLPATTTAALGATLTLPAKVSAWPLNIQWQLRASPTAEWADIAADDARFTDATSETLTIKLTGTDSAAVASALALHNHQIRFRLTNNHGGTARIIDGKPTTLRITTTLGFQTTPSVTVTNPLAATSANPSGTVVNGKLGAKLSAPLGGTIVLRRPALPLTYPAPTYRWERLAPGGGPNDWQILANSVAAVKGTGTDANPQFPAVASPYSGVNTANLTIRLTGPETPAANSIAITTAATLALHQSQYRCVIVHNRGTGDLSLASPATTLTITSLAVGVATQPVKLVYGLLSYDEDETPTTRITVSAKPAAANTPVKYQWEARSPGGAWTALVNHVPPTAASAGPPVVEASPGAPTAYLGVTTATLTIRFPSDKNTETNFGLMLDGKEYRCVLSNVLKNASAPFGPAAGRAESTAAKLRVLAGTVSLVTQENFRFPGLRAAADDVRFSVKGLPKGLTMDPLTGIITGVPLDKPGVFTVTVTVNVGPSVETVTYYIELLPLIGNSSGAYEALLSPPDLPPVAKLALTVSANGTLTGTLTTTLETATLALRGAVVRDVTTGVVSFKDPVVIPRPGTPKGRAYVLTDLAIGTSGKVEVKVKTRENATAALVDWALADSVIVTNKETGNPGIRLATYSKTNRAPWDNLGRAPNTYNLAISAPALLDPESGDERPFPAGSGYATAPVSADGKLGLSGKLADGTKFTASLAGGIDSSFRLFVRPYSGATHAVLSAELPLTYPNIFYQRHSVFGDAGKDAYWTKPADLPKTPNYSDGFGPLAVQVRLEPWFPSSFADFGFAETSETTKGKTKLVLSGAALGASSTSLPAALSVTYAVPLATFVDLVGANPSKFTGKLNTNTGFFSGSFVLSDPVPGATPPKNTARTVPFEGVLLMSEDLVGGTVTAEGFTLVPALPGAAITIPASGRIQFLDPRDPPPPDEED